MLFRFLEMHSPSPKIKMSSREDSYGAPFLGGFFSDLLKVMEPISDPKGFVKLRNY